jgi:hypothetical protein
LSVSFAYLKRVLQIFPNQGFQGLKVLRKVRNTDFIQAISLVAGYTRRIEAAKQGWNLDKLPGVSWVMVKY